MSAVRINIGGVVVVVDPFETPTAMAIRRALPFTSTAQIWRQEIYFETPVRTAIEPNAREVVTPGEMAFWVEGSAIAMGFGPTPLLQDEDIRVAARLPTKGPNVWGRARGLLTRLKTVPAGTPVRVEAVSTRWRPAR